MKETDATHHVFVDESGDAVLFDGKGNIIVGKDESPLVFMLAAVHLPDPQSAHQKLELLRQSLIADPYFAGVPSMRKTALAFHAKDDIPEVRREVFQLLPELGAVVQVAIRRKHDMVLEAQELFKRGLKMNLNETYDDLVERVLPGMIPHDRSTHILFARLGKSDRREALRSVIHRVVRFQESAEEDPAFMDRISIAAAYPKEAAGLQIADYYLWAVQKIYRSTAEARFFNFVSTAYRQIWDRDDRRNSIDGEKYHPGNPLTLPKIKPVAG